MTESWVNNSVFYHIYPLGLFGAPYNNSEAQEYRLDKLLDWIPHIRAINANALYIGPLFESSHHGYDTKDYYNIDKRLGTNDSFEHICKQLHEAGIRIVLDGVFNHVGREFWAFKDVLKNGEESLYCDWFQGLNFSAKSPLGDPFSYEGWSGHYDLVKLNLQNPDVVNHLLGAVEMWIEKFHIDGIRLDAADCIDMSFFSKLKKFTSERKKDFWLMGEVTHSNYNQWAREGMLDSVTNYECHGDLYNSHNEHNYYKIAGCLDREFGPNGKYKNIFTYNFLDNHDVNRIREMLKNDNDLENIYTLLYTMPGIPSVYYGSEWALLGSRTAHSDKNLRPALDLNNIPFPNLSLCRHIRRLGCIKRGLAAFRFNNYENVLVRNEQLVYKRHCDGQTVYVALNLANVESFVGFNVESGCAYLTDVLNDNEEIKVDNCSVNIPVAPKSARIMLLNNGNYYFKITEFINEPITDEPEEKKEEIVIPPPQKLTLGKYRHFKGGEYEIIGFAKHSETLEDMVVYKALYDNGSLWVRPYNMFAEYIERDGAVFPRFKKIEPEK